MPSQTFIRPSIARPSTRDAYKMSLDDLRKAAEEDELEFYRQKANADPSNEAAQEEYKNVCLTRGINPATGKPSRFGSMSKEEIGKEWEAAGKDIEAAELESYRDKNAKVWIVSQPRYTPTPKNAEALIAALDRMGMRGSVGDLQMAFDICVEKGEIEAPAEPVALLNEEELQALPLPELRAYLEKIHK